MTQEDEIIAATLKWFEARPLLEDSNEYKEWEDRTLNALELARAIKYQAERITRLEDALRSVYVKACLTTNIFNGEKLSENAIDAQSLRNQNIRDIITGVLNEGDK